MNDVKSPTVVGSEFQVTRHVQTIFDHATIRRGRHVVTMAMVIAPFRVLWPSMALAITFFALRTVYVQPQYFVPPMFMLFF